MSNTKIIVGLLVSLIIGGVIGYVIHSSSPILGSASVPTTGMLIENYDPYVRSAGGITTNYPVKTNSDLTVAGGSLNVTTANTATSTLVVGCIQAYATSTATAGKILLSTASTTGTSGQNFLVSWQYGTCPNL